jgi:hypothetical protein
MTKRKVRPVLTPEQIIHTIHARCDEVGDCWIWKGAMTGGGKTPNMHHPNRRGESAISVREVVLEALGKPRLTSKLWASNTCNEVHCVCPEHAAWRTRGGKLGELGAAGVWSRVELTMMKAAISQAKGVLNWDKVRDIRSRDAEITHKALASEFGVDPKTIRGVRQYLTWVEYGANPFSGLIAANEASRKRA